MPTSAERQALLFLAAVAIVGGGVRVVAATRFERQIKNGQSGAVTAGDGKSLLAGQIAAVDSARASKVKRPGASASSRARSARSRVVRPEKRLSRKRRRSRAPVRARSSRHCHVEGEASRPDPST